MQNQHPQTNEPNEPYVPVVLPVICPNCDAVNADGQIFCSQCAIPMVPPPEIDQPLQRNSEGNLSKEVADPPNRIEFIGTWLLAGPCAIFFTYATVRICVGIFTEPFQKFMDVFICILGLIFCGGGAFVFDKILYRLTRDHIRRRKGR